MFFGCSATRGSGTCCIGATRIGTAAARRTNVASASAGARASSPCLPGAETRTRVFSSSTKAPSRGSSRRGHGISG
ncbi:MAG: hypothetical protein BRD48_00570 [Bacteroidetes bacterium QS_9_68_14]|nr:MAG: hypothetical protein BRD48_00570 [Bacteroidetes bacterium QS_9_68_14]